MEYKMLKVSGIGIGVSSLERSIAFYSAIGMRQLNNPISSPDACDQNQMVWEEEGDDISNTLMLINYGDTKNYTHNPVKLVMMVKDALAFHDAVVAAGGQSVQAPMPYEAFGTDVAFVYDPDQYLIEIIENKNVDRGTLLGAGIGVSDLDASADFYSNVLGLTWKTNFDIPNVWKEKQYGSSNGEGLEVILMHYDNRPLTDYHRVPAKLVFSVDDAVGFYNTIGTAYSHDTDNMISAPSTDSDKRALIGMARDLDGYLLEVVERLP